MGSETEKKLNTLATPSAAFLITQLLETMKLRKAVLSSKRNYYKIYIRIEKDISTEQQGTFCKF